MSLECQSFTFTSSETAQNHPHDLALTFVQVSMVTLWQCSGCDPDNHREVWVKCPNCYHMTCHSLRDGHRWARQNNDDFVFLWLHVLYKCQQVYTQSSVTVTCNPPHADIVHMLRFHWCVCRLAAVWIRGSYSNNYHTMFVLIKHHCDLQADTSCNQAWMDNLLWVINPAPSVHQPLFGLSSASPYGLLCPFPIYIHELD